MTNYVSFLEKLVLCEFLIGSFLFSREHLATMCFMAMALSIVTSTHCPKIALASRSQSNTDT